MTQSFIISFAVTDYLLRHVEPIFAIFGEVDKAAQSARIIRKKR